MFVLKGFAANSTFTNNQHGVTNKIGEISPYSLTYSREIGLYVNADSQDITLYSFTCKDGDVVKELSVERRDKILAVVKEVYHKTLTSQGQIFADQLLQSLITKFAATCDSFESGEIVTDGSFYVPEWLSWKLKNDGENYIKVWFSDNSFCRKYDESEIIVIPPIDNLDDFFRRSQEVKKIVESRDTSLMMQKIQDAKNGHPESIIRTEIYEYRDPLDQTNRIKTSWSLLIYGEAGNNIDSIKDALVNHILANSTHSREEWAKIFPEIFKRTEFILTPFWDKYAIPNRVTEAGIYSPISLVNDAIATIAKYAPSYPSAHRISYSTIMGHPYKSLSIGVVSSAENRDKLYKITDIFPDFIAVSSISQDFNRMSEATRAWALAVSEMLVLAENMNKYTDLPKGYTKAERSGLLYIVKNFNNIHYLVTAKKNFTDGGNS